MAGLPFPTDIFLVNIWKVFKKMLVLNVGIYTTHVRILLDMYVHNLAIVLHLPRTETNYFPT